MQFSELPVKIQNEIRIHVNEYHQQTGNFVVITKYESPNEVYEIDVPFLKNKASEQ